MADVVEKPCANCGRAKDEHILVVSGEAVSVLICPRAVYDPER